MQPLAITRVTTRCLCGMGTEYGPARCLAAHTACFTLSHVIPEAISKCTDCHGVIGANHTLTNVHPDLGSCRVSCCTMPSLMPARPLQLSRGPPSKAAVAAASELAVVVPCASAGVRVSALGDGGTRPLPSPALCSDPCASAAVDSAFTTAHSSAPSSCESSTSVI